MADHGLAAAKTQPAVVSVCPKPGCRESYWFEVLEEERRGGEERKKRIAR